MAIHNIFRGLGIALITPFTTQGEVDYKALAHLVEYQITNGADFLCILATTAEAPCLTKEEKDKITELIKTVDNRRVPILKYCGGNNTQAVIEEIKSTDWSGIDGILSICPYYNKPSQEGLYQHFKTIASVSPKPIVLYNVPGRTGVNMTAETTVRLAWDCSNIVGIKEFSRMIRLEFNGEYEPARRIHHMFTELYKLLFVDGNPAGVKALLNDMGLIENILRLPLVPTKIETKNKMAEILKMLIL